MPVNCAAAVPRFIGQVILRSGMGTSIKEFLMCDIFRLRSGRVNIRPVFSGNSLVARVLALRK